MNQSLRVKIYIAEIFAVICILSDIILYQGIGYDTVINFLLVFVYMLIIYGTFMARALKLRKDVQEPQIKRAFGSLALMAFSFIVTFCWLFNRSNLWVFRDWCILNLLLYGMDLGNYRDASEPIWVILHLKAMNRKTPNNNEKSFTILLFFRKIRFWKRF